MMSLFWYYRPEHTQGGRDPSTHCEVRQRFGAKMFVQTNSNSTDLCVCETREGTINVHPIKTLYLIYSIHKGLCNQYPLRKKMTP